MSEKGNLICSRKFRYQAPPVVPCKVDSWVATVGKVANPRLCSVTQARAFLARLFWEQGNTGFDYEVRRCSHMPDRPEVTP